jgi:hypothetical protein
MMGFVVMMALSGERRRSDSRHEQKYNKNFLHGRIVPCSALPGVNESNDLCRKRGHSIANPGPWLKVRRVGFTRQGILAKTANLTPLPTPLIFLPVNKRCGFSSLRNRTCPKHLKRQQLTRKY